MKTKLRMFKKAFDFLSKTITNSEKPIVLYVKKTLRLKIQKFLKRKIKE